MLIVKTKVKPSKIHGLGLFADQNIKKGKIIWVFDSTIDKKLSIRQIKKLPKAAQEFVDIYAYYNTHGKRVLCGDYAMFINHSDNPNTQDIRTFLDKLFRREGVCVASRNIKKGEEITNKYLSFDKKGKPRYIIG